MVYIKNVATNVVSPVEAENWTKIKNSPQWKGVFVEVAAIELPPEIKELREKIANQSYKDGILQY